MKNRGVGFGRLRISIKRGKQGFVVRAVIIVLAVVVMSAAGFVLYGKGKGTAPENLSADRSQEPSQPGALPERQGGTSETNPLPQSAPAAGSRLPAGAAAPAAAKAVAPSSPKVAPAGMVYLAKRITITRETGLASFPKGTLVVVKSKAGGKIRGSIQGLNVELSEAEATTVLQE